MSEKIFELHATIKSFTYHASKIKVDSDKLTEYKHESFNANTSKAEGLISFEDSNRLAFAKWVTPKRTRSYPFARLYNTYHFSGKIVSVIPIIKDEGSDTNNDRINFITLSWMNLSNIYILLTWYDSAVAKSSTRISQQRLKASYVDEMMREIKDYKYDAHHWNNFHFQRDFSKIYRYAVDSYERISNDCKVTLHSNDGHLQVLASYLDQEGMLSLENFASRSLQKSKAAAYRETSVNHALEYLSRNQSKGVFNIKNSLGGIYHLTADEVYFDEVSSEFVIQESKNTSRNLLPSLTDVKDGLFKILLFSNIDTLSLDSRQLAFRVQLLLTGTIEVPLDLPCSSEELADFTNINRLPRRDRNLLEYVNAEAIKNGFVVHIRNSSHQK